MPLTPEMDFELLVNPEFEKSNAPPAVPEIIILLEGVVVL